jgi:hypothetical protein
MYDEEPLRYPITFLGCELSFAIRRLRAWGSLAVSLSLVVAVYGLDYVEALPAIYVIHALGVTRVDTIVAWASVYLVVAFAGDDRVIVAAAYDLIVPPATIEAVVVAAPVDVIVPTAALEAIVPIAPVQVVVTAATFEAVVPTTTLEAVVGVGPEESIVAVGADDDLRHSFVPGKDQSDHHYDHR